MVFMEEENVVNKKSRFEGIGATKSNFIYKKIFQYKEK